MASAGAGASGKNAYFHDAALAMMTNSFGPELVAPAADVLERLTSGEG